jgi:hypothetical protein
VNSEQGLIPAGLARLFKITGGTNLTYLSEAELTLNAIMNKNTEMSSNGVLIEPICVSGDCSTDQKNGADRITFKVCQITTVLLYLSH